MHIDTGKRSTVMLVGRDRATMRHTSLVIQSTNPIFVFKELMLFSFRLGSYVPIHPNADLELLGNQPTSSGAGKRDYSVYNGTCESLESEGRGEDGEGGQMPWDAKN